MDRADLQLVRAICQHGTLASAARSLGIAAPAATKRLAALESELGLSLFQRTTRRVTATTEGETVSDRAAELLRSFESLEDELREKRIEPAGNIRLASSFGFGRHWVGPALARFQQQYPEVTFQLQLTEHLPDLAAEGFDGAIWLWNPPMQRTSGWTIRRLAKNQRVLVAAPSYLRQHGVPRTPQDLTDHECLVVRENGGFSDQRYDHWPICKGNQSRVVHVRVSGALSSNSGEMVRDWCLAGHGIMLRSVWDIAPHLASRALERVLPGWSMPDANIHWLTPHRSPLPRRIRLLVDYLARQFRVEPWSLRSG